MSVSGLEELNITQPDGFTGFAQLTQSLVVAQQFQIFAAPGIGAAAEGIGAALKASAAKTLDEALNSAIEEARTWIQVELEDSFELPSVTHPDDLDLREGEFVRNIAVTIRLTDGWDE